MNKEEVKKQQVKLVREQLGKHPIVDAKSKLTFIVRQEDSNAGVQRDPQACAMAKAIERMTGIPKAIAVFPNAVYVPWDKKADGNFIIYRFAPHTVERRSIIAFDETGTFSPGEYTLYPPAKSDRLVVKRKKAKKAAARKKAAKKTVDVKAHQRGKKSEKETSSVGTGQQQISWLEVRNGHGRANIVGKSLVDAQA